MSIRDWPEQERPREKLLFRGPAALSDAELLAMLFRQGIPGKSALDLARDAILHHGGLRGVLTADLKTFSQIRGLGPTAYSLCQAALELGRRFWAETLVRDDVMLSPQSCRAYLLSQLRDHTREVFAALFLDNKFRVIRYEELFHGTIHTAEVHPRIVVQRALHHNAAAIILAHNHPSGCAEPSDADSHLTRELHKILASIDVKLLDHFIIGDGTLVSLSERGLID